MRSFVALALAASALAIPAPQSSDPEGCSDSADGTFTITVVNATTSVKRDVAKRQLSGTLTLSLEDGVLKDQAGRTGYIASNFQFQFDSPPQANALKTSGFSVCSNNTLALDGSAVWYQCLSGNFNNLYDRDWAEHCEAIFLSTQSSGGGATQISDGQPQATTAVTQISDGQPQAGTSAPAVTQISDGQPQAPSSAAVTQISDGQPQAPPTPAPAPITQISDGQPQAPTGPAVSQISDGQPQAPTGPVVTQISDGQPQAPTPPPVSQISDGQPQAPIATGNYTLPPNATQTAPAEFPGAAASSTYSVGAFAAALVALLAML